jgi:hypothetical protein
MELLPKVTVQRLFVPVGLTQTDIVVRQNSKICEQELKLVSIFCLILERF